MVVHGQQMLRIWKEIDLSPLPQLEACVRAHSVSCIWLGIQFFNMGVIIKDDEDAIQALSYKRTRLNKAMWGSPMYLSRDAAMTPSNRCEMTADQLCLFYDQLIPFLEL